MKIPRSIKTGTYTWKIRFVTAPKDADGNPVDGVTSFDEQTIFIDNGLCKSATESVFIHELAHAMLFEAGTNPDGTYCIEDIACALEPVLFGMAKRYKWFN